MDIPLSHWYSEAKYAYSDSELTDSEEAALADSEAVVSTDMDKLCDGLEEDFTDVVDFDELVAPSVPILSSDEFFTEGNLFPQPNSHIEQSTPIPNLNLSTTASDSLINSMSTQGTEAPMPWNMK